MIIYILENVLVYISAPAATLHAAGCDLLATLTMHGLQHCWEENILKKRDELLNSIYYPCPKLNKVCPTTITFSPIKSCTMFPLKGQ
jgi:hypothetical protein